jgi:hypothetical protein
MTPILINGVFPYAARILVLLTFSLMVYRCLWGLLKSRQMAYVAASTWKYLLAARGTITLDDPSNGDALAALSKVMGTWGTSARRGAAIGGLVGAVIGSLLGLPLFLRPSAVLDDLRWAELRLIAILLLEMAGVAVGSTFGQLRSERGIALVPERSTGYNPLLRGRVSDFRATILLAAPMLVLLTTIALVVSAALSLIQPYMAWKNLPSEQHPLLFALPCVAALSLFIVQLISRLRASAPQRIFTYQTQISRGVDFTIRAFSISGHYQTQLNICACALVGQWLILLLFGPLLSSPSSVGLGFAVFLGAILFM